MKVEKTQEKAIVVFDKYSGHLQQFKSRSNSWRQMHQMNDIMKKNQFSAVVYGDYIYVFMENKKVFRLKYIDEAATWEQMANMIERHGRCPPVVVVGRVFYVIGGHNNSLTKCVERFDPETNKWNKNPDKLDCTRASTLLVMRGCIYSFGGFILDVGFSKRVQRFDPHTLEWKEMSPMREQKGLVAAVELNDKAYVMGGFNQLHRFKSVDCYDPEMDQWTNLAPMTHPRSLFRAFAIDGSIHVVGGYNSSPDNIEKYDVEKNEWTMVPIPNEIKLSIHESVEIQFE